MANVVTKWALELIDMVSKPMRDAMNASRATEQAVEDVGAATQLTGRKAEQALANEKQNREEVKKKIKEQKDLLKSLEREQAQQTGEEWQKTQHKIEKATRAVKDYEDALEAAEQDIRELTENVDKFHQKQARWGMVAAGINQGMEALERFSSMLDFAPEVKNIQTDLQRMTGATGEHLDDLTSKVHRLAKVYDEDGQEIARAANATAKQMGVSYEDALNLINDGFEKGANLNGDFLDQLKEYGPQMKAAGISASEMIAIIAKSGKDGVFSDKALDAIKEAGLSLREMDTPQVEALKGIGLLPEDLKGKTTMQAIQAITEAMNAAGVTVQEKQKIVADIFKGAGEDAGLQFLTGIGSMDMDITKLPNVEQAGAGIKGFFADLQSWAAGAFGNAAIYAQQMLPMIQVVGSFIPIIQTLGNLTWMQRTATIATTAATWLWNVALNANPIGIVITAVGLLIGLVIGLGSKFEWAAGIVGGVSNSFKDFGKVILSAVLLPLKTVLATVGAVGKAIGELLDGNWGGAYDAMKAIGDPAKELATDALTAVNNYKKGSADATNELREKKKQEEKGRGILSPNQFFENSVLDGNYKIDSQKKKGKGRIGGDNELSISGSGKGGNVITMTLNFYNTFKTASKMDLRKAADDIAGRVSDKLRDELLSIG